MSNYIEPKAKLTSDEEFDEKQLRLFRDEISQFMSWQMAESLTKHFDSVMRGELENFYLLEQKDALLIDKCKLSVLKKMYLELRKVWTDPALFQIIDHNFQAAHERFVILEKKLKITLTGKELGFPDNPGAERRQCISEKADSTLFFWIKDLYKAQYGRGGVKKFEHFVETKILQDEDSCNFLFYGKGKPPKDFDQFEKIRKTSRRNIRHKRAKNPIWQRLSELVSSPWPQDLKVAE